MIKLKTTVGNQELIVDLNDMKSVHKFNKVYGALPKKCDVCGSENVFLSYKNPKGNDYYTFECGDCGADANFGIHKDGQGLFWKHEKMEKYQGEPAEQNVQQHFPGSQNVGANEQEIF